MDNVELAASLLSAKHNKSGLSEATKNELEKRKEHGEEEGTEFDERITRTSEVLCKRINEKHAPQSIEDDDDIQGDEKATKHAFKNWLARTNQFVEKAVGKKLKAKYVSMFMDGYTAHDAAERVVKKYQALRERRKSGVLSLLKSMQKG